MAEPTRASDVFNYKKTGNGIYKDIEANVVDVCRQGFTESPQLIGREPATYHEINPKTKSWSTSDLPGLFVWVDGSGGNPQTIGQLNSGSRHSDKEEFYANIEYIHSTLDDTQGSDEVKAVAAGLRELIVNNSDLNGLVNHYTEIVDVSLIPEVHYLDGRICPVNSVSIRVIYRTVKKTLTANRRRR